jgi:ubiquinone biosynthesis monooxygenase Coq7
VANTSAALPTRLIARANGWSVTDLPPARLVRRILRVDHAGEHGAVSIYTAQLAVLGDRRPDLRGWLAETLAHEQRHRSVFLGAMPARSAKPCRAMFVWAVGGWLLGRLTVLAGPEAVMACTAAVESTVHAHLKSQAAFLDRVDPQLAALVRDIQTEEHDHLAFAERHHDPGRFMSRLIRWIVAASTETLIAISTRGDSLRLERALAKSA